MSTFYVVVDGNRECIKWYIILGHIRNDKINRLAKEAFRVSQESYFTNL